VTRPARRSPTAWRRSSARRPWGCLGLCHPGGERGGARPRRELGGDRLAADRRPVRRARARGPVAGRDDAAAELWSVIVEASLRAIAARGAHTSGSTKTRCPSAQTMKYGPGRQLQSSSRCHRISTRCTDPPQSWQGGEARAIRSALSIARRYLCVRSPFGWSSSIRSLRSSAVSVRAELGAMDHLPGFVWTVSRFADRPPFTADRRELPAVLCCSPSGPRGCPIYPALRSVDMTPRRGAHRAAAPALAATRSATPARSSPPTRRRRRSSSHA